MRQPLQESAKPSALSYSSFVNDLKHIAHVMSHTTHMCKKIKAKIQKGELDQGKKSIEKNQSIGKINSLS